MTSRGGMETGQNWLALARKAWQALLWGVLGFFWLLWFEVSIDHMIPRLGYLVGRSIAVDPPCVTPECDFSAFWPAGLLARAGAFTRLYTPDHFFAFQKQVLFPNLAADVSFFYPPFTLLPSSIISWLPFEPAFFVWTAVLMALSIFVLRYAGLAWRVILAGLLCPAALWNIELGQLGIIDGALLVAGLMSMRRNQAFAGGVLGFLACKPQAGVLVPFALLAARNWPALFYFTGTIIILGLLTLVSFGPNAWLAYETIGRAQTVAILQTGFNSHAYSGGGTSVFWMFRSAGANLPTAYLGQACCTLAAVVGCFRVWHYQEISYLNKVGITVLLSLLATPYGYVNDMVAGSLMLAALVKNHSWKLHVSDVIFWLWPAFCQLVSEHTGILLTPLVILFSVWRVAREAGLFRLKFINFSE